MFTVYCYDKCSTCRDALKWLAAHQVSHTVKPIRATPPSVAELQTALDHLGGDLRKLFNTSGMDYRALGLKDRLPAMPLNEALTLLATNGNLVKRPLLLGDGLALAGFKVPQWQAALGTDA